MNETCEVNKAPIATGDDDPRYKLCGAPAHYKVGDTWMCARHYDGLSVTTVDSANMWGRPGAVSAAIEPARSRWVT